MLNGECLACLECFPLHPSRSIAGHTKKATDYNLSYSVLLSCYCCAGAFEALYNNFTVCSVPVDDDPGFPAQLFSEIPLYSTPLIWIKVQS